MLNESSAAERSLGRLLRRTNLIARHGGWRIPLSVLLNLLIACGTDWLLSHLTSNQTGLKVLLERIEPELKIHPSGQYAFTFLISLLEKFVMLNISVVYVPPVIAFLWV